MVAKYYGIPHLLFISSLCLLTKQSAVNDTTYVAAVVEFTPQFLGATSVDLLANNTKGYLDIINQDDLAAVDIIIFPESTLNNQLTSTFVPDPTDNICPCDQPDIYEDFLVKLSCAAKRVKKYLVINITSKENCTKESQKNLGDPRPCRSNGLSLFNTNVVFDRTGTVVSKYRKVHPFGEAGINTTFIPDVSTFTTDFGVTFGHFICFDILFETPANDLIKKGITDIIFPTMWFSELPFLTAVQQQFAWAYANNVNFLSAGANIPSVGSTGSAIIAGNKGFIQGVMSENEQRKVYVGTIEKMGSGLDKVKKIQTSGIQKADNMFIIVDNSIDKFSFKKIENVTSQSLNVCQNGFCCQFDIVKKKNYPINTEKFYEFRAGVFNDLRSFQGIDETHMRTCGIYACNSTTTDVGVCGGLFSSSENPLNDFFEFIQIKGTFPKTGSYHISPSTSKRNLFPLDSEDFTFYKEENQNDIHVVFNTTNQENLLTFGIISNYYNSTSKIAVSYFIVLVLLILIKYM